ncbi:glucosylglycerol-phosphate synthase [Tropicimonas sp. IMCC34011]|uniref:glucosylglycerol-phosphate synthase n=1 Tax=Tropicimonas sp. IMCC34011 TaxID=2248759 RepID=UPI000E27E36B|nr:glucosylglycerol-phosphate synthase [Tropicimonas sp. IMCC34011]
MPSDLVIVYHRQPYEEVVENGETLYRENKSPNGIVPTLKGLFGKAKKGSWVAWKEAEDPNDPGFERVIEIEDSFGTYNVSRLPLTKEQVRSFYHVTSKEAFWPILHSFKDRYNYDPVDWPTFREVNWAFAEAAANEAAEGALVWVHDYNLWLVPGYLRKLRPDVTISFFHHTPFPSADMFNVLPWREEIVSSLLSCDVVGFHIPRYAANFARVAQSLFDCEISARRRIKQSDQPIGSALDERSMFTELTMEDGRKVALSASPVGIDVDYVRSKAEAVDGLVGEIKADMGEQKLILSVSRTDYTKGGIEQLLAYERLLQSRKDLIGKVRLMHVSVMANRNMTAYAEIQAEVEQIAGRINGTFGTLEWQPLALISQAVPFDKLVAYYRAADICWITPLADGMNLVCKEYIAARVDGDGVVVLSEFAGAAVELPSAILTNPFSSRSMDVAIEQGLAMSEPERRDRMKAMREQIEKADIKAWGDEQLSYGKKAVGASAA